MYASLENYGGVNGDISLNEDINLNVNMTYMNFIPPKIELLTKDKTVFTKEAFAPYRGLAGDCMGPALVWWFQNVPGLDNAALDDAGQPMLNWWPFIYY